MNKFPSYHCLRVSGEVWQRLLRRDPNANLAVAKLVYTNLDLDDPMEAANVLGYLSGRTYNTIVCNTNLKTIRELLDWTRDVKWLKGVGAKGEAEIQALRRHFRYGSRVGRRPANVEANDGE